MYGGNLIWLLRLDIVEVGLILMVVFVIYSKIYI